MGRYMPMRAKQPLALPLNRGEYGRINMLSTHACIHWYLGIQIAIIALLYVSEIVRGDVMHEEGERSKLGIGKRSNGPHPELLLNALFGDSTSLCTYKTIHPVTINSLAFLPVVWLTGLLRWCISLHRSFRRMAMDVLYSMIWRSYPSAVTKQLLLCGFPSPRTPLSR